METKALLLFVVNLLLLITLTEAFKILVVFPFPSTSHGILGDGVVRHLLDAGHEITYITPFPKKEPPKNLHQVDVGANRLPSVLHISRLMDNSVDMKDQSFIFDLMLTAQKKALENDNVQKFIHDTNQKFDVVISEWMFGESYCGFAVLYDSPCIWFFPFEHYSTILELIDTMPSPALTPSISTSHVPPLNFIQRVKSLFNELCFKYVKKFKYSKTESDIYEKAFLSGVQKRGRSLPSFDDMRYNVSLALVNSHVSLGHPMSVPPNFISVGGYHVETKVKPLPNGLKKIMDDSKDSVIYFSMGSNLQSKDMPVKMKEDLLKLFGTLKHTVLWKFEEELPNVPKNVHILKWAPQPSILAHPNCVLFITHGGLLSLTETVHFGVPLIGIPVFADQFLNVDKAVLKGIARRVDLSYTMANELSFAIQEMISNPRYRERVKELSMIYHDRPVPPGVELVHWVEHVVRTRGALHMRSPAQHVPFYQKMYLDLLALILAILFIVKRLVYNIFFSKFFNKSNKKKTN